MPTLAKLFAVVALALIAAFAATQTFVPSANAAFTDTDADGAIDLAEEVFGSDPNDAASTPETRDAIYLSLTDASCVDGLDNDGDGLTDAQDGGCINSDGSFPSDETELILGTDPEDDEDFPEDTRIDAILRNVGYLLLTCANGDDDDLDGLTDADDPGCDPVDADSDGFEDYVEKALGSDWEDAASEPEHVTINPGSCNDALDNDADTLTDGADEGCIVAPNDNLADAIVIDSLPFTHTAKAANTTVELGERVSDCSGFNGGEGLRGTVWYEYTPPAATHVIVDASGSDLLSSVSVWRVGDAFGLAEVDCATAFPFFGLSPRFAFEAVAGETHYIQVERFLPIPDEPENAFLDLDRLSLHLEATTPPPNDAFANAQPITSLPFEAAVDTIAASVQGFEPHATCQNTYPANSIWYRYTPTSNTYVLASVAEGAGFAAIFGVYEGTSLGSLEQVACGERQAFRALTGHTYYLQFAGNRCSSSSGGGDGSNSGHSCFESRAGHLKVRIETLDVPSCPAPQFTFEDSLADTWTYGPPRHPQDPDPMDVASLSLSLSEEAACVAVEFEQPPPDGFFRALLDIDADLVYETGTPPGSHDPGQCDYRTGLGLDHPVESDWVEQGILSRVFVVGDDWASAPGDAFFVVDGATATFIVPSVTFGNALEAGFALEVHGPNSYECLPNSGHIACTGGACAFVPFRNGDANCVPATDAIDAAIVLQYGAGLLSSLPCPTAADVDGNGVIDSRDAALILQYGAGLLDQLPPIPCRKPPEFC